ncbi:MAG: hypothetical protein AAFQ22_08880 [Pseudomonadota bacterium]
MKIFGWLTSAAAALVLAGCGGGDGGGSSGGGTVVNPPTGGGSGESQASREIPDIFRFAFRENEQGFVTRRADPFLFTEAGTTVFASVVLEGADSQYFNLILEIGEPNSNGQREIVVVAEKLADLDFEAPIDEDGDNIYEFDLVVNYEGEVIRVPIEVSITDVDDGGVVVNELLLFGETNDLSFGLVSEVLPDLDGDGLEELGVSVTGTDTSPSSAFVFTGAYLSAQNGASVTVPPSTDFGIRILESGTTGARNHNRVSARARPDGNGSDLLVSTSATSSFSLVSIAQPSDFNALTGNTSVESISSAVVFEYTGQARIARLIGDVNGDGENDIFVHDASLTDGPIEMGIIFGSAGFTPGTRAMAFDLAMTAPERILFDEGDPTRPPETQPVDARLDVQLLPDADADGFGELLICTFVRPNSDGDSRNFYLRAGSAGLTGATPLDLGALAAADGYEFSESCEGVSLAADLEGDGSPTVIIDETFTDPARLDTPPADPGTLLTSLFAGGVFVDIGDIDADGVTDFFNPGSFQADGGGIWLGTTIQSALQANMSSQVAPDVVVNLQNIDFFARTNRAEPVFMPSLDLLVLGYTQSESQQEPTPGYLVFIDRSELAQGLNVTPRSVEVR